MFLSKLFGIFKKKDKQQEGVPGAKPVIPTAGTVGAAVGLSQPNQTINPGADKLAQAPTAEPDFPKPDVDTASETINPEPATVTPAGFNTPPSADADLPQPPVVEELPVTPETSPLPPQETPAESPQSDDSQNIAV